MGNAITQLIKARPSLNKTHGMNFELVTVTPHTAKQWIEQNVKNRRLKTTYVDRLARDMAGGRWRITGDAIRFGEDGALLDGQHRLAACIKADVPFTTIVIYGLPNEVQDVMDIGCPRSASDVLSLHGMKNSAAVGTAYKYLLNEKRGGSYVGGSATVTTPEIMAAHAKHPRLPLYVPMPRTFPRGVSISLVGFVRYAVSNFAGGAIDADAMVEVLKTGVPSYDGDAMHKFRERMISNYAEATGGVGQRTATINTFKACWNKFVKKEPVKVLRMAADHVTIDNLDLDDL